MGDNPFMARAALLQPVSQNRPEGAFRRHIHPTSFKGAPAVTLSDISAGDRPGNISLATWRTPAQNKIALCPVTTGTDHLKR
jgi:hypothetical protein